MNESDIALAKRVRAINDKLKAGNREMAAMIGISPSTYSVFINLRYDRLGDTVREKAQAFLDAGIPEKQSTTCICKNCGRKFEHEYYAMAEKDTCRTCQFGLRVDPDSEVQKAIRRMTRIFMTRPIEEFTVC